jgi:hypothetical protein
MYYHADMSNLLNAYCVIINIKLNAVKYTTRLTRMKGNGKVTETKSR